MKMHRDLRQRLIASLTGQGLDIDTARMAVDVACHAAESGFRHAIDRCDVLQHLNAGPIALQLVPQIIQLIAETATQEMIKVAEREGFADNSFTINAGGA